MHNAGSSFSLSFFFWNILCLISAILVSCLLESKKRLTRFLNNFGILLCLILCYVDELNVSWIFLLKKMIFFVFVLFVICFIYPFLAFQTHFTFALRSQGYTRSDPLFWTGSIVTGLWYWVTKILYSVFKYVYLILLYIVYEKHL